MRDSGAPPKLNNSSLALLSPKLSLDSSFAKLKSTLGLPLRLGWNGDPCVPEQHPWSGVDCQYDRSIRKHVIDGLALDNQGLKGFLPNNISRLRHLQSINLSGLIPSSLGTITSLEILDLSFNSFNRTIPETLGQLTSLRILDLNGNSLSGKVRMRLGEGSCTELVLTLLIIQVFAASLDYHNVGHIFLLVLKSASHSELV
ncbi:Receptor-like protein 4 [Sesamum alatum]|uniref:Receptor-like protein 4 n=1 Tax=Sesamum alatum TaxID=300844 RepID=A0AAE2CXI8_9LAMI|nr:Receptor-like protein 4 [Sesamum alatum]